MSPPPTAPADPAAVLPPPPARAKPRGNPNLALAPRCGARTRAGCPCRSPAIHGKLRCRMHGGRSPGPRTPEGRIRVRNARTIHGNYGAKARADNRFRLTLLRINRVSAAAARYLTHLPPAFAARLHQYPQELMHPPRPIDGITAAQDRDLRHAVAASLAPWHAAIARARTAHRAARAAATAARPATPQPNPNTPARPPRPRAVKSSPLETLLALFAANRAAPAPPANAPAGAPRATPLPGLPEPLAPEPAAAPPAPPSLGLPRPLASERPGDVHAAARHAPSGHAPRTTTSLGLSEPLAPVDPRSPTPPHPTIDSLLTARTANLHALHRAADAPPTAAAPPAVRSLGGPTPRGPKPLAPAAARTPRAEPLAPDPAPPAPLNRAARRRLKYLQRRRDHAARLRP